MRSRFLFILLLGGAMALTFAPVVRAEPEHGKAQAEAEHDHDEPGGQHDGHADDGHAAGGGHVSRPDPLKFEVKLAVWTAVVFVLFYLVMSKFAWRPIIASLERREQGIAGNIAGAEAQLEEAKLKLAAYEEKLAVAAAEVREIVEAARREAEANKAEILAEAKAAAAAEHERAMRDVQAARAEALRQIGDSAGGFAVELARRVIERDVPAASHEAMVRARLSEFSSHV